MKTAGILVINKPEGITSFDVIRRLRVITGIRKMGHAGTLDPFASGILIIGIGNYTRILDRISSMNKEYIARAELGLSTDTADITGNVIKTATIPDKIKVETLQEKIKKIKTQFPPRFSALKVKGIPAYKLARQNKEFKLSPREIKIKEFKIIDYHPPFLTYRAVVSKGTYIRTLTEQIADLLGTVGTTRELQRTSVGKISLDHSTGLADLNSDNWLEKLKSVTDILRNFPKIYLQKNEIDDFYHGRQFRVSNDDCLDVIVLDNEKHCLGFCEIKDSELKPRVVFR